MEIKPHSFFVLSLPSHFVYFFFISILHYNLVFDCKFIWKSHVNFSFIELIFVMVKDRYLEGLSSNAKLFADDMFLFSVIHNSNTSALELNSNMAKINRLAFQWKMIFNPDPKNKHRNSFLVRN